MSSIDALTTAYRVGRMHGWDVAARQAGHKLAKRTGMWQPRNHFGYNQKRLLHREFDKHEQVWIIWFDGGRYDWFDQLVGDYFDGRLYKVWNGDVGYTGDWSERHLRYDFEGYGLFSLADLQSFGAVDYDSSEWFSVTPEIDLPSGAGMHERLAALGYREASDEPIDLAPKHTNEAVREHIDEVKGGIIRYCKPHPPFVGLEKMTQGSSKTRETRKALYRGELSESELVDAYVATYRQAFDAAADILPELEGRVIITADHGECLTCGQLFHGRNHVPHGHLVEVPWFEVRR